MVSIRRSWCLLVSLVVLLVSVSARAQSQANSVPNALVTCRPSHTLDELVLALDDAVSGPVDKDRTCLRQLLLPDARLIPVSVAPDGKTNPHVLGVDDWIARVQAVKDRKVLYERQVKVVQESFGHIAHLWSTYEVSDSPGGKATIRGINSIQAVFVNGEWKVQEILWQAENSVDQVPPRYLPSQP